LNKLDSLNCKRVKIPSGEITNTPYLREVAKKKLPIILSTGMSNMDEINKAVNTLFEFGASKENLTILHCISEYPTPLENANLFAIDTLFENFDTKVGFSDHTLGSKASIIATSMGASVIEKHITLDKSLPGPDHLASMEPEEFKLFVADIKSVSRWMGNGIKEPTEIEKINRKCVRKSLVASKKINKGDIFSENNLTAKRPADGISPVFVDKFYGIKSNRDYEVDDLLEWPNK